MRFLGYVHRQKQDDFENNPPDDDGTKQNVGAVLDMAKHVFTNNGNDVQAFLTDALPIAISMVEEHFEAVPQN